MAMYAGEVVRIRMTATEFSGNALGAGTATASVSVWDPAGVALVDEEPMTWDPSDPEGAAWHYDWVTPAVAGAYRSRVTVTDPVGSSWEYKVVRLRRNPV